MQRINHTIRIAVGALALAALVFAPAASADQVILDDLIVDGSACVGQDCVNGESFGFDTIRLKENNLRIKFQDTSSTASFPSNDWQLTANDSSNGGANKFSIDDIDGGRTPMTIEAGAPSHSLYVDSSGRLGIKKQNPVTDIHIVSGNTPTLRLEQDGSSGFTAQTWDVAGNEANFFVRDATNGSKLVFRVQPGAPSNNLFLASDGDIGIRTSSPTNNTNIDIVSATTRSAIRMAESGGDNWQLIVDPDSAGSNAGFSLTRAGTAGRELRVTPDGDLDLRGNCIELDGIACTTAGGGGGFTCNAGSC